MESGIAISPTENPSLTRTLAINIYDVYCEIVTCGWNPATILVVETDIRYDDVAILLLVNTNMCGFAGGLDTLGGNLLAVFISDGFHTTGLVDGFPREVAVLRHLLTAKVLASRITTSTVPA